MSKQKGHSQSQAGDLDSFRWERFFDKTYRCDSTLFFLEVKLNDELAAHALPLGADFLEMKEEVGD